ncbi:MAG: BACON domain-containing protein [Bacteroidales bacterium]|nr:BACON domain-containing protein [Bacteroidales bacterium]
MKKTAIFLICILALCSCEKRFSEDWQELRLDFESLVLPSDKDESSINIYYNGAWTAELTDNNGWIRLAKTSGKGVEALGLLFSMNSGLSRAATLTIKGGETKKVIRVVQRAGFANPRLEFSQRYRSYPNGAYKVTLSFDTNIPSEFFSAAVISAKKDGYAADWISDIALEQKEDPVPEEKQSQFPTGARRYVSAIVQSNDGGTLREAVLSVILQDAANVVYKDSITIIQNPGAAYLTIQQTDVAKKSGGERIIPLSTNLTALYDDIDLSVSYPDPQAVDFVSNVKIEGSSLKYELSENTSGVVRYATLDLSYTDLDGVVTQASPALSIEQTLFDDSFDDIELTTANELMAWNGAYNDWASTDHIRLGADIDLQGQEWTARDFEGSFDGQGHKVYNYTVSGDGAVGFFSSLSGGASVSNLILGSSDGLTYDGVSVVTLSASSSAQKRAGGLAAEIKDQAVVSNVTNFAPICFAEGLTGGAAEVGGIVAYVPSAVSLSNCINNGDISLSGGSFVSIYVGGIVGNTTAAMTLGDCSNTGNVVNASTCSVAYTNNTASGASMTAGIIGSCSAAATLNKCENAGNIESNSNSVYMTVSGIIGFNKTAAATMTSCVNRGNISCAPVTSGSNQLIRIAGFVGHSLIAGTKMDGCENYGDVTLNNSQSIYRNWLGGAFGYCKAVIVSNCKFNAVLSRGPVAGGKIGAIVGQDDTTGGLISNSGIAGQVGGTALTSENFLSLIVGLKNGSYTTNPGSAGNYFLSE